jgi:hypothetical protein
MKCYVFRPSQGGTARMVTDDRKGAKLPAISGGGSWVFEREIYIPDGSARLIGASSDAIRNGIQTYGYCRWPLSEPDPPQAT